MLFYFSVLILFLILDFFVLKCVELSWPPYMSQHPGLLVHSWVTYLGLLAKEFHQIGNAAKKVNNLNKVTPWKVNPVMNWQLSRVYSASHPMLAMDQWMDSMEGSGSPVLE